MLVTKHLQFPLTYIVFSSHTIVVTESRNCLVIFFFAKERNAYNLEQHEGMSKWLQDFSFFWMDYPFKST